MVPLFPIGYFKFASFVLLFPLAAAAVEPVITSVEPSRIAGRARFTLTLTGEGFTSATKVRLGGLSLSVGEASAGRLVASGELDDSTAGLCAIVAANGEDVSSPKAVEVTAYTDPPAMSETEAFRFLQHATFGPSRAAVDRLRGIGYANWFVDQFDPQQASSYPEYLNDKPMEWSQDYFFQNAVSAPDQLRQRMAFALHKIFVVSANDISSAETYLSYLRILHQDAFGNFGDLMRDMTLNAAMGEYLNMLNNAKVPAGVTGSPNENYARELLQLFSIGLAELNPDGSSKIDAAGNPIPSYGQREVIAFARAFTGWTYSPRPGMYPGSLLPYFSGPMVPYEPNHDTGEKLLFNGVVLPAGQTARQDLEAALRNIFEHPNVGPFLARGLIQQFVTSNPSPEYIARVARVFNDNGSGVRGDLKAVIQAVLRDAEATDPQFSTGGHLREPALYLTALLRLFGAQIADHPFITDQVSDLGQRVLYPPSVFSYFSPSYRFPGSAVTAPEFQIVTAQTAMMRINTLARLINNGYGNEVTVDLARFTDAAGDTPLLLDMVNREFFGGRMEPDVRRAIFDAVQAQENRRGKALTAIYLAGSSPFFQVVY
jgi:uncharacterized protein (DUF1800 family)